MPTNQRFSLDGKVAVVTGATGVLGGAMAHGLAEAGARVAIMGRREARAAEVAAAIRAAGGDAMPLPADVLDREQLLAARTRLLQEWSRVDILINCAGGNIPGAVIFGETTFFNMSMDALDQVTALNLTGTVLPTQVFGESLTQNAAGGSIINISSMAAMRAITRVLGYSVAKAGVDSFTRWLATEFGRQYGDKVRVNAIAPGFFVGEQNRSLLLNDDGSLTPRGQTIVDHTPMGRFGAPDELVGTAVWLASDASRFVTGIVVPVDGGFSAFSGV
ncbi:MAG: SDR family oxidoreductase [Caldilineaceae bacterium]|nr:SDR family oxidoreductase [Caldilineaceae bacterium]